MFTVLSARRPSAGIGGPREGDALENGLQAGSGRSSPEESIEFSVPSQGQSWADERVQLGHGAASQINNPSVSTPERAGASLEKAPGRPRNRLALPKGACRRAGEGRLAKARSDKPKGNGFKTARG